MKLCAALSCQIDLLQSLCCLVSRICFRLEIVCRKQAEVPRVRCLAGVHWVHAFDQLVIRFEVHYAAWPNTQLFEQISPEACGP
jgi:hypothetical protein